MGAEFVAGGVRRCSAQQLDHYFASCKCRLSNVRLIQTLAERIKGVDIDSFGKTGLVAQQSLQRSAHGPGYAQVHVQYAGKR